jgi:hypothetical protein
MGRLFQTKKTEKLISIKKFLLALFVSVSVVAWIGIATLLADEDDPAENMENTEVHFQNAAQEQHARNVAIKAALQDPDVIDAISKAKESGNFDDVRTLFKQTVADNTRQISDLRAEGKGWGEIVKEFGVHPRYLGLGHFKNKSKYSGYYPTQHHMKSEIKAAKAGTAPGSQKYNDHKNDQPMASNNKRAVNGSHGVGHGRGNGGGNGGGHGRGNK